MNNKEGELKRRIRENAEDWEDTPWQTLKEELNEGVADVNTQISLDKLFEILDEAKQDFPKVHKNYWDERGHLVTYEETVLKWREKWFGGVDESE